ncbi:hypothetical protein K501DRAFT_285800 [Backusella circina FSU 941]|nr:hypothetical protein K501DRAFT_285800 [Backusella circina FSU 941]
MVYLRILRSRCWVVSISIITFFFLYLLLSNTSSSSSSSTKIRVPKRIPGPSFNRLSPHRRHLLTSAIAHIRIGYVANRTPDIDTPPLLITASSGDNSGTWADRLIHIVNAYYFSMLMDGSAFAYDMHPVPFESIFDPVPIYMALSSDRATQYLEKTTRIVAQQGHLSIEQLTTQDFAADYQDTKIVQTFQWFHPDWIHLQSNPSMAAMRDKYRLNHLALKSDWFFIASRLLFARPAGWLQHALEPYRELMGGHLQWGEGLSLGDPTTDILQDIRERWFRIGVRLTGGKQDANCIAHYVASVCQRVDKACHVFISAENKVDLDILRRELRRYIKYMSIHAVAERYPFKEDETRTMMDWILLSRMDYLVGQKGDLFLTTAAWAAQVQTDVKVPAGKVCRVMAMSDW